ncbi:hypothetical protein [Marinobacter sp.]|uniref:hypothetical protein n=1 Tax=Marinobacter sp. TaxID=50741 RepID=UPI003564E8E5
MSKEAAIEFMMQEIEEGIRNMLTRGQQYILAYRNDRGIVNTKRLDTEDLISAMIELDSDLFDRAVVMTASDPIEASRLLTGLMNRALGQIIGMSPIREAAELNYELEMDELKTESQIAGEEAA